MYLPSTFTVALIFLVISFILWGGWPNTLKFSRGRFEFFYWDFIIAAFIISIFLSCTMGVCGEYNISFWKEVFHAHLRHVIRAFVAGILFNVSNFLLVGAASVCGIAYAFLACFGSSLVVDSVLRFIMAPAVSPLALIFGNIFLIVAIFLATFAYHKIPSKMMFFKKGVTVALLSGILLGLFFPLLAKDMHLVGMKHLSPYAALVVFTVGLVVSNFIINIILMKKPLFGHPLVISDYFRMRLSSHLPGLIGGVIWGVGLNFRLIAMNVTTQVIEYGCIRGAPFLTVLFGVYLWKEFPDDRIVNRLVKLFLISYFLGLVLVGVDEWLRKLPY